MGQFFQVFSFLGSVGRRGEHDLGEPAAVDPAVRREHPLAPTRSRRRLDLRPLQHLVARSIGLQQSRTQGGQLPRHQALPAGHAAEDSNHMHGSMHVAFDAAHGQRFRSAQFGPAFTSTFSGTSSRYAPAISSVDQSRQSVEFVAGNLEDQFVVDLQQHACRRAFPPEARDGWRSWQV